MKDETKTELKLKAKWCSLFENKATECNLLFNRKDTTLVQKLDSIKCVQVILEIKSMTQPL
jgi:hypothetical protein